MWACSPCIYSAPSVFAVKNLVAACLLNVPSFSVTPVCNTRHVFYCPHLIRSRDTSNHTAALTQAPRRRKQAKELTALKPATTTSLARNHHHIGKPALTFHPASAQHLSHTHHDTDIPARTLSQQETPTHTHKTLLLVVHVEATLCVTA